MYMENRRNRENVLQPFRTPRYDAPPCNSKYWEGKDYSYIYHLAQHYVQELRANKEQSKWCTNEEEEEGIDDDDDDDAMRTNATKAEGEQRQRRHRVSKAAYEPNKSAYLHTYPETKPSSWLARLLYYIAPSYFQREQALRTMLELQRLSSEELLELMQLTLAAGEMERSSEIARELSLRRVNLTLQPVHEGNKTTVNNCNRQSSSSLPEEEQQRQQQSRQEYHYNNNNQTFRHGSEEHCSIFAGNVSAQRANGRAANTPFANKRMTSQQSHWH